MDAETRVARLEAAITTLAVLVFNTQELGDSAGHPFRGNQWTQGGGPEREKEILDHVRGQGYVVTAEDRKIAKEVAAHEAAGGRVMHPQDAITQAYGRRDAAKEDAFRDSIKGKVDPSDIKKGDAIVVQDNGKDVLYRVEGVRTQGDEKIIKAGTRNDLGYYKGSEIIGHGSKEDLQAMQKSLNGEGSLLTSTPKPVKHASSYYD